MDHSKNAATIFDKYAIQYEESYMDVSLYKNTFDYFCNSISEDRTSILELACGPGNISKYILEKRPDFQLLGIDLAPSMLELARINAPQANFKNLDCREISTLNKKFDGIICGFCLPYLSVEEVDNMISDCAALLSNNGIIYLSTMEGDYSKSGLKKREWRRSDSNALLFRERSYNDLR